MQVADRPRDPPVDRGVFPSHYRVRINLILFHRNHDREQELSAPMAKPPEIRRCQVDAYEYTRKSHRMVGGLMVMFLCRWLFLVYSYASTWQRLISGGLAICMQNLRSGSLSHCTQIMSISKNRRHTTMIENKNCQHWRWQFLFSIMVVCRLFLLMLIIWVQWDNEPDLRSRTRIVSANG
jgi:hypothetical protein